MSIRILGIVVAIIILAAGVVFYQKQHTGQKDLATQSASSTDLVSNLDNSTTTPAVSTSTNTVGSSSIQVGNSVITAPTGATIRQVPITSAPKAPDYMQPITFAATVSPELKKAVNEKLVLVQAALNKSSSDFNAWITLGTLHKMADDFTGAEKIWTYASVHWPNNTVTPSNLGDLYTNFLKEYPKAEASFQTAIARSPNDVNAYRLLFELYSQFYKTNTTAAADILKQGIAKNPKAVDLYVLLGNYYKSKGDTTNARIYYTQGADVADAAGQKSLAAEIRGYISQLK